MEVVNTQHLPFELTKEYLEEVRLLIQNQATEEIIRKTDGIFFCFYYHFWLYYHWKYCD
jgi:hypothetical protein